MTWIRYLMTTIRWDYKFTDWILMHRLRFCINKICNDWSKYNGNSNERCAFQNWSITLFTTSTWFIAFFSSTNGGCMAFIYAIGSQSIFHLNWFSFYCFMALFWCSSQLVRNFTIKTNNSFTKKEFNFVW